mmetsp:Transcript_96130/g.200812  ORF Transcript_96130/g.200812 Transcript_96130/m.200812 type:complete len:120 (-) Transcript_96130:182-541(-)
MGLRAKRGRKGMRRGTTWMRRAGDWRGWGGAALQHRSAHLACKACVLAPPRSPKQRDERGGEACTQTVSMMKLLMTGTGGRRKRQKNGEGGGGTWRNKGQKHEGRVGGGGGGGRGGVAR